MEIGSFIELQFPQDQEFYFAKNDIARLNSGRVAIWHAFRILRCKSIWLPYYQCDTVRDFLIRKNVDINYYHIDNNFNPIDLLPDKDDAVLFVNYYGVMSSNRMEELAHIFENVIIDNSQAFFCKPINNCINIYSCRKFIGVPDGAYVIGKDVHKYIEEYPQCFSSDTSLFLLQRIEYGCEGKAYESRAINEHRIDTEDAMQMSALTRKILSGTDYMFIQNKRKENFKIACILFDKINCINAKKYYDEDCIPMVYPLVIEKDKVINSLQKAKHFQGHWWSYLLNEMPNNCFEYWISKYLIPITIDQRYGVEELESIKRILLANLG